MRKRLGRLLLLALVVVLLVTPVALGAEEPKYGGTLRVATTTSVPTLDPMVVTHVATREVGMHIFESLVTFDENFAVVPMLAESWDISPDGLVYTFYLRKGVPFHNGKEMKAEDVWASVVRFLEVSPRKGELANLEEVKVIDDYTVEFRLSQPTGPFLAALANPIAQLAIMPREAVEGKPARQAEIIGTGPYKFVEWIPDRHVKVVRFEDYKPIAMPSSGFAGDKAAYIDEILFIPVPEPGARVAGLEAGDYDFADFLPAISVPDLMDRPDLVLDSLMPYTWPVIYFNFARHFGDLRLRQAVQAGLDLEEIMIASSDGAGRLDPGMYFQEQVWHSNVGAELYNQKNLEKAKALMKEAGYGGEEIIVVTNTDYEYMYKAAIVLEQQLKKMGFNVKLVVLDWPGSLDLRSDLTKWDIFFSSHSTRFDPSANDFYFMPGTTFFAYDNPEMVKYLQQGMASTSFEDRYRAYEQAQRIFYEDVAMIKLYDLGIWQGWQEYVKGYRPWVMINFNNVWLDK
ncbi:MAG: ABC transporter substrate-binding protein [Firmicutes bacterium]|nr:ABC transporter substrate-binding protein [Bacillota bacterium]